MSAEPGHLHSTEHADEVSDHTDVHRPAGESEWDEDVKDARKDNNQARPLQNAGENLQWSSCFETDLSFH